MTLEDIYRENYPIVYGYLLSLCGNPTVAEDLAAETFLKAIQNAGRYDGSCKPSTWLCTIGRNLYFNERRWQKRHVPLDEGILPAPGSLEERYIQTDLVRRVYRLAESQAAPGREVFLMRLSGLSFRQIGEALGKTENWARVTYFRVKTKILDETEANYGQL